MNILYLAGASFPSRASSTLAIMRMCQAFADAGHKVTLSGRSSGRDKATDPIVFYGLKGGFRIALHKVSRLVSNRYINMPLLIGIESAFKTRRLIREIDPDIIYCRFAIMELIFVPRDLPIFCEMHSLGPLAGNLVHRLAFKLIVKLKHIKRVVVTTNYVANLMRGVLPGMEVVVARHLAEEPISIDPDELDDFRKDNLKGVSFKYHVGYTGAMDTYGLRGTDVVIQAAARMPHVAFHLVGGQPAIVEHWRRYSQEYNQHGNIFFYGHRNPREMPYFLNCFDVVLSPVQYLPAKELPTGKGASPIKVIQYMAYGKAIVASDLPSHRECLRHGETALLVTHDDVGAWVESIDQLMRNPDKRAAMSAAGQAAYRMHYTPQNRVQRALGGIDNG